MIGKTRDKSAIVKAIFIKLWKNQAVVSSRVAVAILTTLYDVELWHEYANQMRALSKRVTDPRTRQHALAAAAGFERIAELATKLRLTCERRRRRGWAA